MPSVATLALLVAPAAASTAAWVAPQTVTTANGRVGQPPLPAIAADAGGDAFLALIADKAPQYVQVVNRPLGTTWNAVQEIGTTPSGGVPVLAVDPAGNAITAWADNSATAGTCTSGATNSCFHVAFKPAGSVTWAVERSFNAPSGGAISPGNFAVAIDPRGNGNAAVVFVTQPTPGAYNLYGLSRSGGAWGSVATILPAGTDAITAPAVAIDGAGRAVAMFDSATTSGACPCGVKTSIAFGSPAPLVPVTQTSAVTGLFLNTNEQAGIDAAWVTTTAGVGHTLQTATLASGGGAFGAATNVAATASTTAINGPRIVTASDGESVAAWTAATSGITVVDSTLAAVRPPGGAWGSATPLDGNTGDASGPGLTIDSAGNATAVWHNASTGMVRNATHTHGGAFGGTFSGPSAGAGTVPVATASDAAGDVHAVWTTGVGTLGTAVLDQGPPSLDSGAAAAAVAAGDAVPFQATASDAWSAPVSVHWDFGDGQSADGASASHSYGTPGSYRVIATATDASGNSTSQAKTVTVTARPPAPLPRPVAGTSVNLEPAGGTVRVRPVGTASFVPLVSPTQVQTGVIVDARHGRVRITIDNGRGGLDTADFYGGIFRFTQPKVRSGQTWFADLFLFGGSFKGCPAAPRHPKLASLAKKPSSTRSVRHLWGSGHGAFRTVGRFASATVRGTTWLTDDRCNGTLTKVTQGKVAVRDFVKKKTVVVKAPRRYLAQAKR